MFFYMWGLLKSCLSLFGIGFSWWIIELWWRMMVILFNAWFLFLLKFLNSLFDLNFLIESLMWWLRNIFRLRDDLLLRLRLFRLFYFNFWFLRHNQDFIVFYLQLIWWHSWRSMWIRLSNWGLTWDSCNHIILWNGFHFIEDIIIDLIINNNSHQTRWLPLSKPRGNLNLTLSYSSLITLSTVSS